MSSSEVQALICR